MIFLYILLGIFAVAFLALMIPVKLFFLYGEETELKISYIFYEKVILPEEKDNKPHEEKKSEEAGHEKKEGAFDIRAFIDRNGLGGFISLVKDIVALIGKKVKKILKHLKIIELDIYASAGGDNVTDAAMLYGEACAVIYSAYGFISSISSPKYGGVSVDLDYEKESFAVCELSCKLRPLFVLIHGLPMLLKLLPYINKLKKQPEKGKNNERK